jgi:hypothetical protein
LYERRVTDPPIPPINESRYAAPPSGIRGMRRPWRKPGKSAKVIIAQAMMLKNIAPMRTLIAFSKPEKPPTSTKAQPTRECATAPQDCGTAPPVMFEIPRPQAFASAADTATVHSTR